MSLIVDCKNLKGKINVPYSKSMAHRYLLACFLSGNYEAVKEFEDGDMSDDILATKECIELLMLGRPPFKLNCRESGTTLRFIISLVAALGIDAEIIAQGTLVTRPMKDLITELERHGCSVCIQDIKDDKVYFVSGKLRAGEFRLSSNISSQFVSSLLFALPLIDGDSTIVIDGELESKPYVDLTLLTLKKFGINVDAVGKGYNIAGNQKYAYLENSKELLEGDWSQGAMWLAANYILNTLEVNGLDSDSIQADKIIQDILKTEDDKDIIISAKNCPDLVPAISLWALSRCGKTIITDVKRLEYKESNRAMNICNIINQVGGNAKIVDDTLIIVNTGRFSKDNHSKYFIGTDSTINTYNDHRLVMFACFVSIMTEKPIVIDKPESVAKSYPKFFEDIEKLGGNLKWS